MPTSPAASHNDPASSEHEEPLGHDVPVPEAPAQGADAGDGAEASAERPPRRHRLRSGEKLGAGKSLTSPNGRYRLTYQGDGNLVLYDGPTALWASLTDGQPAGWVRMRKTGALVIRTPAGAVIWQTSTSMLGGVLVVQDDGNVVIYEPQGSAVWATNTWVPTGERAKGSLMMAGQLLEPDDAIGSSNGRTRLVYQADGNLVVYDQDQRSWASHTNGRPLGACVMQTDGNLVIYARGGEAIYASDTRTAGSALVADDAGDVAMLDPEQRVVRRFPAEPVELCVDPPEPVVDLPPRRRPPVPPQIEPDGSVIGVIRQPLAGETPKMWDIGATVRVKFQGGSAKVREKVRTYAQQWTDYANIQFNFVADDQAAEIRVAFVADKGNNSHVGRDALGVWFDGATMNLASVTDGATEDTYSRKILHEFGHAIGLIHEHQSPAAGIPWDREKVYAWFRDSDGWDRATIDQNIFERYDARSTNYSVFDPDSIMCYPIDASLTLNGKGFGGKTVLSATDKEYIGRWYPGDVTPAHAVGMLRTGDDCDEIDFRVEYGVAAGGEVRFQLDPGSGLTWWKAIEVPTSDGGWFMMEMQDRRNAEEGFAVGELDTSRPVRFWKAKGFGVHTRLGYTWPVTGALPGGSKVFLQWKRDRC